MSPFTLVRIAFVENRKLISSPYLHGQHMFEKNPSTGKEVFHKLTNWTTCSDGTGRKFALSLVPLKILKNTLRGYL